jgi:hypothetical protein
MYYDAATLLKATKRLAKALQLINSSELSSLCPQLLSAADQLAAAIASPVPAVSLQKAGFELSIATAELCAIVAEIFVALNFKTISFFEPLTVVSLAVEAAHMSVATAKFSVTAWSSEEISVAAAKLSAASAKLSATAEQKAALKLSAAAKNLWAATSPIHAGKLFLDEALFTELFQQDTDGLSPLMTAVNDHGAPKMTAVNDRAPPKRPQELVTTLRTLRSLDAEKQGKLIGQCNHQNQNVLMVAAQCTNGALSKLLEVWPSLPLEDQIKIFTQCDKNGRNLLLLAAERNSTQLSEILTLIQSFESKVQALIFEQCSDQWGIIISAIRHHPQAMSKLRTILLTLDLDHSKRFLEKLQSEDWAQIREIAQKDQIFSAALAGRIKAAQADIPTENLDSTTFHHLVQLATSSFLSQLDQDIQEGTAASLFHFETILSLLKHSSRISDFAPFFQNMIQKLFSYYPKAMEQEAELAPIAKQTSVLRLIQSILQQLSLLEEDLDQANTLDNLLILTSSIPIILKGMQYLERSTQARIFKQYNASGQNPLMLTIAQDSEAAHFILEAMHSLDQADQSSILQQRDTLGWSALTLAALTHSSAFPAILATMGSLPKESQAIILNQCSSDGLRAIILAVRGSDQAMTQLRISLFCIAPADSKQLLEKLQDEHWEQIREILPGKVLLCAGLAHWIKRSQAQIAPRYLGTEICNELITMYFEEFFTLLDHDIREGATKSLSHFKTILSLLKHSSRISDFAPFFQQLIQKLFDNYPKTGRQGTSLTTNQQTMLTLIQGILEQLSLSELGPIKDIKLGKKELQNYCKLKYFSSESFAINIAELLVFNSFFTKSDWASMISGQQKNCSKIIQQIQTYQRALSAERPELSALLQNLQQTAPSSTERSGFAATLARVFSRSSRGRESGASDENGYHA